MVRLVGLFEIRIEGAPPASPLWTVGGTKTSKKLHPLQAENQLPDEHMHTEEVICLAY
jgi:hypothetical protein